MARSAATNVEVVLTVIERHATHIRTSVTHMRLGSMLESGLRFRLWRMLVEIMDGDVLDILED